ncbi:hypothetical protein IC575_016495 [Cucumis melo]
MQSYEGAALSQKMAYFHKSSQAGNAAGWTTIGHDSRHVSPASLSESLKAFFGHVLGSESFLLKFELLEIPKLRMEACIQVARSVAEAYELIYDTIMDPNNRYSDPTTCKASFKPDKNDFGNITIEI